MKPSPSPVVVWSLQPTKNTHTVSRTFQKVSWRSWALSSSPHCMTAIFFLVWEGGEYPAGMALTKQSIMSRVSQVTRAPFITACYWGFCSSRLRNAPPRPLRHLTCTLFIFSHQKTRGSERAARVCFFLWVRKTNRPVLSWRVSSHRFAEHIFSARMQKTLSCAVTTWAFITQSGFGSTKEKVRDPTTAHQAGIMWERCRRRMLISADKTLKPSLPLLCLLCYGPVDEPVLTWKQYKRPYACLAKPFISKFCISLPKRRLLTSRENFFDGMKVLQDSHEIISHFLRSSQFLLLPFYSSESVGTVENYSQHERR